MATWNLDPDVVHLNHGSFGAAPVEVLAEQQRLRERMERNPVAFMLTEYQELLEVARSAIAEFVHADAAGTVFVPNATYGVNSVLRSWEAVLQPGDEIVITDHIYNACRNAVDVTASRTGAVIVPVAVPFPVDGAAQVTDAVLGAVTDRCALVVIDHVTSPTGIVVPVADIVAALEPDVPVLIDGAHAPGMVDVDLAAMGASFYTANCHKWICSPKGAAFLHVAERHRDAISAVSISHGHNGGWPGSTSDFHARFDWTGTDDPSARLSVPTALDVMGSHRVDGWSGLMAANHEMVLAGRELIADALGLELPAPDEMIGSIAALRLPDPEGPVDSIFDDLTVRLRAEARIEVPVFVWPEAPQRLIRVSAQVYNAASDYERLADALVAEFAT